MKEPPDKGRLFQQKVLKINSYASSDAEQVLC
jgi:hypothetical protein